MAQRIKIDFKENYNRVEFTSKAETCIRLLEKKFESNEYIFESTYFPNYLKTTTKSIEKIPVKWKDCYDVSLNITSPYQPCDSIGLLVPNSDNIVNKIIDLCGFEKSKDRIFKIERIGLQSFNYEGTLHNFIKYRMDVHSIPRKRALFELAKSSDRKQELEFLCSRDGNQSYLNLIRNRNSLIEIIEEFKCKPSIEELLMFCEILKPRYYSMIQEPNSSVRLLIGTIVDKIDQVDIYGHVSLFIKNLFDFKLQNVPIEYCFRKSQIFNNLTSDNLICFCTGTGIAPYLSFEYQKRFKNLKLIYGFRNIDDNLAKYFKVCDYVPAQSSEGYHITDFVDSISEFGNDCNIFICGNSKMQKDLFELLKVKYSQLVAEKKIFFDSWL